MHTPLCTPIVYSSTKKHLDSWLHRKIIYMSLPLTPSQASCPAENRSYSPLQTINLQQIHFPFIISFILSPQRGMWVCEVKIHLSPDVSDLPAFIPLAVSLSPHTTKHSLAFPLFESEALTYTRERDSCRHDCLRKDRLLKRSPLFSFLVLSSYVPLFIFPFPSICPFLSFHTAH